MPALEAFRRLNGHCRVPYKFVVPSDENWPRLSWGLNLGTVASCIRQGSYAAQVARSKSHLEALGFAWDYFGSEWSERIMPALETFRRLYGHCRVPQKFVVPSAAAWPEESHGHKLGSLVSNIRSRGSYFDQIARTMDALKAIEFDSKRAVTRKWEERVEPMLATFEQLHGHRDVPHNFVVPSSSPWEEKDWGIQLGKLEREEPLGLKG